MPIGDGLIFEPTGDILGVGAFVSIHVFSITDGKALVVMRALAIDHIVVMRVISMAKADLGPEFMGLRDFLQALQIPTRVCEGKALSCPILALGYERHILCGPAMAAFEADAEPRRNSVLEYFQGHHAMTGIDSADIVMMMVAMIMIVVMMVIVMMRGPELLFTPRAPKHPDSDSDDDDGRCKLEIGFGGLCVHAAAKILSSQRDEPHDRSMGDCSGDTQHDSLRDRSADGDDEGRHHGLGMSGFQAVQRSQKDGRWDEQPRMGGALLNEVCEGGHGGRLSENVNGNAIGGYGIYCQLWNSMVFMIGRERDACGRARQEQDMTHTIREKQKLINRVRRLRGQMEGIERMLDEEKGCAEVMHAIAAVRGAINGLMGEVIEDHVRMHVADAALPQDERDDGAEELIDVLRSYLK